MTHRRYPDYRVETLSNGASIQRFDDASGTRYVVRIEGGPIKSFRRRQEAVDFTLAAPAVEPLVAPPAHVGWRHRYRTFDDLRISGDTYGEVVTALREADYGRPKTNVAYRIAMAERVRTHFAAEIDASTNAAFVADLARLKLLRVAS